MQSNSSGEETYRRNTSKEDQKSKKKQHQYGIESTDLVRLKDPLLHDRLVFRLHKCGAVCCSTSGLPDSMSHSVSTTPFLCWRVSTLDWNILSDRSEYSSRCSERVTNWSPVGGRLTSCKLGNIHETCNERTRLKKMRIRNFI